MKNYTEDELYEDVVVGTEQFIKCYYCEGTKKLGKNRSISCACANM